MSACTLRFRCLPCFFRRELFRDPKVKFSGYKHPHPLDNDIIVRIQTAPGEAPAEAFIKAAKRLEDEYRYIAARFSEEVTRERAEAERL